jgi:hypothetical protein
LPLRTGG